MSLTMSAADFQQQQRIILRIATLVWRCLLDLAPTYLQDLCYPTLGTRGRSSLCSMEREGTSSLSLFPVLPQGRLVHSRWSVALPSGMDFRRPSDCRVLSDTFYYGLKTVLFSRAGIRNARSE